MRAVVSERQVRLVIEKLLREHYVLAEQDEPGFSFPNAQYNSIVSELDRLGIEKNGMMLALAAMYLREGNDDQFVRSLLASHPVLYNGWHNRILVPFLEKQGQEQLPKQEISGGTLSPDVIDKMTGVLNSLGKQNLIPLLKKHAADWNKRAFKYPSYSAEILLKISDYAKSPSKETPVKTGKEEKPGISVPSDAAVSPDPITKTVLGSKPIDLFGKKFSYEDGGEPQGVIVAKAPNGTLIGAVYSKASIKDPIFEKMGRFISEEEANQYPDWLWPEWVLEQTNIKRKTDKVYEDTVLVKNSKLFGTFAYNRPSAGGKKGKLFIPFDPKKPKFESTLGAQIAASEGKCSISPSNLGKEIKQLDNLKGEDRTQQIVRLAHCIRSWTTDSIKYAVVSSVVSGIVGAVVAGTSGPAGAATGPLAASFTEALTASVPGFLSAGLYSAAGMKESAARQTLVTIIDSLTPGLIEALGFRTWKQIFANLITGVTLSRISSMITTTMFGNDYGLEASDYDEFINGQKDESIENFKARHSEDVKQIQSAELYLRKLYPNI